MNILCLLFSTLVHSQNCTSKNSFGGEGSAYPFALAALPYPYDLLSSYLSERIVNIHYKSHTNAYLTKLNSFILENEKYNETELASLVSSAKGSVNLIKFAGGLYNHYMYFWTMTGYNCSKTAPSGSLLNAIESAWSTFDKFKTAFETSASSVFGNGWTWLCAKKTGLVIINTEFQVSPLMLTSSNKCYPILGIDLWEHAYYLKYLASRAIYVTEFWSAVDWDVVETFYKDYASKSTPVPF